MNFDLFPHVIRSLPISHFLICTPKCAFSYRFWKLASKNSPTGKSYKPNLGIVSGYWLYEAKESVLFASTQFPHFHTFVCVTKLSAVRTNLAQSLCWGRSCTFRSLADPSKGCYSFKSLKCILVLYRELQTNMRHDQRFRNFTDTMLTIEMLSNYLLQ